MLTLRTSRHIRTMRHIKSFRAGSSSTGVTMAQVERSRIQRDLARTRAEELRRQWLAAQWGRYVAARARACLAPQGPVEEGKEHTG